MKTKWYRRFLPRSLYGRAAMILIVPVVTIQLVVSVTFIQRHFEGVTRQMTGNILLEISYLLDQVNSAPEVAEAQRRARALSGPLRLDITLPLEAKIPGNSEDRRQLLDLSGREMITTLHDGLPEVTGVDLLSDPNAVDVRMTTRYGPMRVVFDRHRVSASNPHQLLVLMIATSILMTLIAYLFLRNQLRPVTRLALAAEAFGKGRSVPYRARGANEVRAAGLAFLEMRARIERQIEQRTLMLSGVSHDLRTPLTRLKLGLEMAEPCAELDAVKRDVTDMEHLLDAFLAFARGDATEDAVSIDPVALVQRIVENAQRAGHSVTFLPVEGEGTAMLRPQAVSRAIENLIGNAVRYGKTAQVRLAMTERMLRITVEDDGPGIPAARREEAVRPFTRLDASRNQDKGGGVGLGLSIAADIASSHGGSLRLGDSEAMGGLKAELVLAR